MMRVEDLPETMTRDAFLEASLEIMLSPDVTAGHPEDQVASMKVLTTLLVDHIWESLGNPKQARTAAAMTLMAMGMERVAGTTE